MLFVFNLGSCVFVLVKVTSKDFEIRACWNGCEVNTHSERDSQSFEEWKETLGSYSAIEAHKYTLSSSKIIRFDLNFTF
jgi:hypothetical protein